MHKFDKVKLKTILSVLRKTRERVKILDLGCGDGLATELAAELALQKFNKDQIYFVLVEPLSALGKVAYKRIKNLGFGVKLVQLEAEKYFPTKDRFDLIMSTRAAHHFRSLPLVNGGAHLCLVSGGFIYFDDLLRPNSKKELTRWLKRRERVINHSSSQKMAEQCVLASYNKSEITKLFKKYPGKLTFREDWLGRWSYIWRNK